MRILYILPAEGFGGAERQGVVHIRRLRELGHDVVPFVGPGRPIRMALEDAGVGDYRFCSDLPQDAPRPLTLVRRVRHGWDTLSAWRRASSCALEVARSAGGVDLVFASRPVGWAVGAVVAHRLDAPIVWRGGAMPTSRLHTLALRTLARWFRPDALITNAMALHNRIAGLIGAPSYLLRNGVDVDRFSPQRAWPRLRAELDIAPAVPVIGVSARPHPDKGFDLLAAVVARMSVRFPTLRVLVAGEDGWRKAIERGFREDGLGARVTFLGHVRDIENFYRSCDVIALSSRANGEEALPNAILEAMAMERPFVATAVGGLNEVVTPGREGLLSPPGNVEAYAHNLGLLLEDETLRRRMGRAGRATIIRGFQEPFVVGQLAQILTRVVLERARARSASAGRAALEEPPRAA